MDELRDILRLAYAAIGKTEELDLSLFPVQVRQDAKSVVLTQDFRGGMTETDLQLAAHSVIHQICSLVDHGKKFLRKAGKSTELIDDLVSQCEPLQILLDLWNRHKHGGADRAGGFSKRRPQITEFYRGMRCVAEPGKPFSIVMFAGKPEVQGKASVIISGVVSDSDGKVIGDLYDLQIAAANALRDFFVENGATIE